MTDAILKALKANFPFTLTWFGSAVSAQQPVSALIIQRGTIANPKGPEESRGGRENWDALIRRSGEKSSIPKLSFEAAQCAEKGSVGVTAAAHSTLLLRCGIMRRRARQRIAVCPQFLCLCHNCSLHLYFFPLLVKISHFALPLSPSHSSLLPAGFFFSPWNMLIQLNSSIALLLTRRIPPTWAWWSFQEL